VSIQSSGALRSVVVRLASDDPALLHVRLRDDAVLPDADELRCWLTTLAGDGSAPARMRTAALYPRAAARFEAAGFEVVDRLVLLRAGLDDPGVQAAVDSPRDRATRTMRHHHLAAAAAIDRAAFGPGWGHTAKELAEICRATPVHAARRRDASPHRIGVPGRSEPVAFAIAGASSEHGYLQRLAVDPGAQRRGHGRALTIDALRWMTRRRLPDCLVNTSIDNAAALELYRSIGFTPMEEQLTVLEVDLCAVR
jgi:ribosomal protein S18 acetylase RimI-like enzyme